uniref:50S ribosomal protein L23 n=1 Tax=Ignisphaera aggregans TaxID=334771 RepID=A0A7C2V9Q1_9CREN
MTQEVDTAKLVVSVVASEKAYRLAEIQNYLVFKVLRSANKKQIKEAIEKLYNVKVVSIKTLIDRDGYKKAYVRLAPEHNALDILERLTR